MNPSFVNAAEMLPVPKAARLGPRRLAGTRCVWCGGQAELALGPRISVIGSGLKRWDPRGCRACVQREAARVHGIHIRTCARCSHRDYCPDSRALHALSMPPVSPSPGVAPTDR